MHNAMKEEACKAVALLERKRALLLAEVSRVSAGDFGRRPAEGSWSVAEILVHLVQVESAVLAGANRAVQRGPARVAWSKHLHVPLRLAAWRVRKVKSPIPLDSRLMGEGEALLARLGASRQQLLRFLEEIEERDFRQYGFEHPFFGYLNLREWFSVVAWHEVRHARQIRETAVSLGRHL